MHVYISGDGDHIGRKVGQATMADDVEAVRRIDQSIVRGNELWRSWVNANLGEWIEGGGDEFRAKVSTHALAGIEDMRRQYAEIVGATISVGVGKCMSESAKALMVAKVNGGDRTEMYTPDMESVVKELQEQATEEKGKIVESLRKVHHQHMGPRLEGMNVGSNAGFEGRHWSQSQIRDPAAGRHTYHRESSAPKMPETSSTVSIGSSNSGRFGSELHRMARIQYTKDSEQQSAQQGQFNDLRQQVVGVLTTIKDHADKWAKIKEVYPELYQSMFRLMKLVIALGKQDTNPGKDSVTKTLEDGIRNLLKVEQFDPEEIAMGIEVEKEHTNDESEARKIAIDHLKENPKYYSKLRECGLAEKREKSPEESPYSPPGVLDKDVAKSAIPSVTEHASGHQHLPVGTEHNGKVKVVHNDGGVSWKGLKSGKKMADNPCPPVEGAVSHPESAVRNGSK